MCVLDVNNLTSLLRRSWRSMSVRPNSRRRSRLQQLTEIAAAAHEELHVVNAVSGTLSS